MWMKKCKRNVGQVSKKRMLSIQGVSDMYIDVSGTATVS